MDLAIYADQFGNGFDEEAWGHAAETIEHAAEVLAELQAAYSERSEKKLSAALGHNLHHSVEMMAMGECALAAFAFSDPEGYRDTLLRGIEEGNFSGSARFEMEKMVYAEYDLVQNHRAKNSDPAAMISSIESFLNNL